MSTQDARREGTRRRRRNRRVRRLAALLVLFPLMLGAGLLGSNVVSVFGTVAAPPPVPESDVPASIALESGKAPRRPSERVPITIPVPVRYDVSKMKSTVRKPLRPYIETGSHVSQSVRNEVARLARLSQQRSRVIVLPHRGMTPPRLVMLDALFELQPDVFYFDREDREDEDWQRERDYLELTPGDKEPAITTVAAAVPEPGTALTVLCGLLVLAHRRRNARPL